MTFLSHKLFKVLIHVLFWMLFIFISFFVFPEYHWKENPFLHYFIILLVIVYTNDFALLPFFVKKKMYVLYIITICVIAFLATQLYCYVFAECGCSILKCLSNYLWQTLVPVVFFSFIWMLFHYIKKQDEIELLKKKNTEIELQYLKSQINPHVLLNTLNTIYSYTLEKPNEVGNLILMLSDNLKHVLYESSAPKVPLKKEIEFIDNYIAFQKIRTENVKTINYQKNILDDNHLIAPLLLITLIENAFKHSAYNSCIEIFIEVEKGVLDFTCENTIGSVNNESNNKLGLINLEKRLNIIYKNNHKFQTVKSNDSYKVLLKINL